MSELITKAAAKAYQESGGDVSKATQALMVVAERHKGLRAALLDPFLETACNQAVRRLQQDARAKLWGSRAIATATDDAEAMKRLAQRNLLDFPLPNGMRLADASKDDVGNAIQFYRKQANDMAWKARWLQLVAQSVPGGKKVGDALTEERLRELQTEANDHEYA